MLVPAGRQGTARHELVPMRVADQVLKACIIVPADADAHRSRRNRQVVDAPFGSDLSA